MAMSVNPAEPRPRYKPYPKCKDSGVEWLGEIPAHWEVMQLGQTIETILDFRGRTPLKLGMDWGGDIPAISAANVRDGYLDLSRGINYGSQALHDRWMSQGPTRLGDIVFTTEAPLGNVALLPDNEQYILSQRVVLLRPSRDRIRSEYLRYFLSSAPFRQGLESQATGSTAEGVKRRYLVALPACVPEIDEQIAVAALLDRETARIDGLVAKKERLIELLQEKRTALITRAVTKGLDPNVPMKDSGVEWLGKIPARWEIATLKRRARRIQTGSTPPTGETKYYENGVVPWYGPSSFSQDLPLREPVKFISDSAVRDGVARTFEAQSAVIVTIGATIGKVAFMEHLGSCNQQITGVTFDLSQVSPRYGAYQLKRLEPVLRGIAPNTTLPILDQEEVGYLPFVVPPIVDQEAIAAFLDRETARLDALVAKVRTAIDRLRELRTALISAAVTGKIDVRQESP